MRTLFAALAASIVTSAALADAVTTRIETRPYYGAIVTIEQGVRVWRALPPHDRIIINPEGRTPVTVGVNQGGPVQNSNSQVNVYGNPTAINGPRGKVLNVR
jgi:hypothetical protein